VKPTARSVALQCLRRIEQGGAYANLLLINALARSGLDERDRAFATELVYGTTRMRRACDALVDRFVARPPTADVRTVLRLGAYQLHFTAVPAHAAVDQTVRLAPKATRAFVNAVLRRVADTPVVAWPSDAARLSYPDWIVARLAAELGPVDAEATLEAMNEPATVDVRADGYVQDRGSQLVVDAVGALPGERVLDGCAAPGGKATGLAAGGAFVVGADVRSARVALIAAASASTGHEVAAVLADGTAPPFAASSFDRVLLDAPCSGLGSLRRRPDARWRISEADVIVLADLQRRLLAASAPLVGPGGTLVYSVCTLLAAESTDHPAPTGWEVDPTAPGDPWEPVAHGWRLVPHRSGTDGMTIVRFRRPA
jgi:16S rRNA (cytosine967-C5)-methyltransferase